MKDWVELTKPRITTLVLVTTGVGYVVASGEGIDVPRLLGVIAGTALASGGAGSLNHVVERDVDALMHRTRNRPIPTGRIAPLHGLAYGLALAGAGVAILAWVANPATAFLALATIALYVGVYTPLKRRTSLNSLVGAIPGAIPPVMGWTAVTGRIEPGAWVLFAILFLWQLPHFLSIAWMFREDYARADLRMLPVVDPDGITTGRQVALYSVALIPVSLSPTLLGLAGTLYFFGALALGIGFFACGLAMAIGRERRGARRLLLASVTYLPALLLLLVVDRVAL